MLVADQQQPVTLMAAGGYMIHTFPTGQGNIVGNPLVPVIKISANPRTVRTMGEHIDNDVSGILRRDMIPRTARGRMTAAEALGHRGLAPAAARFQRRAADAGEHRHQPFGPEAELLEQTFGGSEPVVRPFGSTARCRLGASRPARSNPRGSPSGAES